MLKKRYVQLFSTLHPTESLIRQTLISNSSPAIKWHWIASACAAAMILLVAFHAAVPPRDILTSSQAFSQTSDPLLSLEQGDPLPCCDVRKMELHILRQWIHEDILHLDVELVGQAIHPDMVITWRLYDGHDVQAFHLLWDEAAYIQHAAGRISHLLSFRIDEGAMPPEGKSLTLAVNNYDCGYNHDLFPHFPIDAVWTDIAGECLTVDFTLSADSINE